jgi:hypothetical protein
VIQSEPIFKDWKCCQRTEQQFSKTPKTLRNVSSELVVRYGFEAILGRETQFGMRLEFKSNPLKTMENFASALFVMAVAQRVLVWFIVRGQN